MDTKDQGEKRLARYRMIYADFAAGLIDPPDMHEMLESDAQLKDYCEHQAKIAAVRGEPLH